MGIVSDVGRAWIGCPSIGFDGCALSQVGGDKTVLEEWLLDIVELTGTEFEKLPEAYNFIET